ncbi:MAG: hypothetical protein AABX33_02740 [Nanoarchaeota archaeon]
MVKSQSAVEFIILASFMIVVIVGFFAITSSKILDAKEESNRQIAQDIAEFAYREIAMAKTVNDGYTRLFTMPESVNGVNYSISIVDNKELIVDYLGYEYFKPLPANVTGNISRGLVELKKINGVVFLNTTRFIVECNDAIDNDGDGDADLSDAGCSNELDNDESNCGDGACEGIEGCLFCSSDCGVCPLFRLFLAKVASNNALRIDENGNAILRGTLSTGAPIATSDDELIVRDSSGNNIAVLNLITGNMVIQGEKRQNWPPPLTPSPSSNDFVVKDSAGNVVAYIDEAGDFYLKGSLTENG